MLVSYLIYIYTFVYYYKQHMKTATKKDLSFEFAKQKGLNINSTWCFKSEEEANEYAKLKIEWWGSNLVYLGCDIIEGFFSPKFNVWD